MNHEAVPRDLKLFVVEQFCKKISVVYSLFMLVMCIPFLRISSPSDFVKCIGGK